MDSSTAEKSNKHRIVALLKSIETGDPEPVAVVNEAVYIQHNPQTEEGSEGLAQLFARLSRTGPKVNAVRAFEDGDYVFAHMEYDFSSRKICFEVFRFEDGRAVEHWDNIQERQGPNPSGHSMVDGPTQAVDHHLTEQNRNLVRQFVEEILIGEELAQLGEFVAGNFVEHNPQMRDGMTGLMAGLQAAHRQGRRSKYQRLHRVLAEGNFVLAVSEGVLDGAHSAFYDLFRVDGGKIVEHWDTTETVVPRDQWKNDNGKF